MGMVIIYPWKPGTPLKINDVAATATTHKINLQSADLTFSGNRLQAAGNMTRSARNVLVDMDISADSVDLDSLIQALKNSSANNDPKTAPSLPVKGSIRFKADQFNIGKFTWNPLQADISLNNDTADVTLKKAALCGISTLGTLKVSGSNIEFDLQNGRFDLTLLVAPLVTLDRIFERIPLIGGILETLDTIPLSAKGTLEKIQIYPLEPSSVGYDLKEMLKKTFERPINLIHWGNSS